MKFLEKLGLALFSIITLVLSIVLCLIAFGWMESSIFSILIGKVLLSQTYTYIMIGVCVFLILLAIRCIFFTDQKEESEEEAADDGILLQNEDGRLLITVETLKNMVQGVINSFPNIIDSAVGVIITKENNIIISVSIDVTSETIIKETSSRLQIKIKKAVKDATDLDIESVNVRVRNVEENSTEFVEKETVKEIDSEIAKSNKSNTNKPKSNVKKSSNQKVATKNKSK